MPYESFFAALTFRKCAFLKVLQPALFRLYALEWFDLHWPQRCCGGDLLLEVCLQNESAVCAAGLMVLCSVAKRGGKADENLAANELAGALISHSMKLHNDESVPTAPPPRRPRAPRRRASR